MQEYRRIISKDNTEQAEAVDLGLSVKWCNHNVGGTNPEDYGYYFSWGNVDGHEKTTMGIGYSFSLSNYYSTPGYKVRSNIPVDDDYDIARKVMGAPWRLPTRAEFNELYNNTDSEWVNYNGTGVYGRKFMKKSDHSVYIFFPACGHYRNSELTDDGIYGEYWSSTYYGSGSGDYAYYMDIRNNAVYPNWSLYKYCGLSGRAVCD